MIEWAEKIVLLIYGILVFIWAGLFFTNFDYWTGVTKRLLPNYLVRIYRTLASKQNGSLIVKEYLKAFLWIPYIPVVCWASLYALAKFYPLEEYVHFLVPVTLTEFASWTNALLLKHTGFSFVLSGGFAQYIMLLADYFPMPIFKGQSETVAQGFSIGWLLFCNVYFSKRAEIYMPLYSLKQLKKRFIEALIVNNVFPEAKAGKKPSVRVTHNEIEVITNGVSLSLDSFKANLSRIESNLGCRFIRIRPGTRPDAFEMRYTFEGFPKVVRYNPEIHRNKNSRCLPFGTNGTELVVHDFSKDAHILIAGQPNKGKTQALKTLCASMFNQEPNTILIVIDAEKGVDFRFLEVNPEDRAEYLRGEREAHDIHEIPLVLVVTDKNKVPNILTWVMQQILARRVLCRQLQYMGDKMEEVYKSPNFVGDRLPNICIMTDESAFLDEAVSGDDESIFKKIVLIGRAFDINCVFAMQEGYQKNVMGRRKVMTSYSFYQPKEGLELLGIKNFEVPNEPGVFCYRTDDGGICLAKGLLIEKESCAPFIAQQTKKANRTTHRLFQELKAAAQENFDPELMDKVERKLNSSKLTHTEPVITNYREAA